MTKLVVGPVNKGLKTNVLPFNIDNDSFPKLVNAYQWRGRVKRKRGTSLLGRLQRFLGTTDGSGNLVVNSSSFLNLNSPVASGIVTITVGSNIFIDPGGSSPVNLLTTGPGTATLDRSTGTLTIIASNANTSVFYNPSLPVMGLEDLALTSTNFPGTLAFDTEFSYNIQTTNPYGIYDVSFYKNPIADSINLPNYVPKATPTTVTWNGNDYQQFWTTNYQGALWATNGIDVPFKGTNIGMQFAPALSITYINNTATTIELTISNCPLVVGDFVFLNEWTLAGEPADTLNFQSGYVTAASGGNPNTITITLPFTDLAVAAYVPGIVQYLTNRSDVTKDCLRWYDGDPTNGSATSPAPKQGNGWVNFMPPLSNLNYSIADLPLAQYYLVGARIIVPFKDRLLFFGAVVQTSSGSPIYLQDTVVFSQNGSPYYTTSFTDDSLNYPVGTDVIYHSILLPVNQTGTPSAYFEDIPGFGGFQSAAVSAPITTFGPNEDVLLIGFQTIQTRFVYTGNDLQPFAFFLVNSELGSSSTFSSIVMDKGVITRGNRGYVITSQVGTERIDVEIPDQVFEVNLLNNGTERFTAQRDYINEWIYFTYPSNQIPYKFPNQTLLYNYRDNSWAIFNESYTTYGTFRRQSGYTWATLPKELTWNTWNTPWNSGVSTLFNPEVIAGNQQGFVFFRETRQTAEATSISIQNIIGNVVTSPNHNLNNGDYIIITGAQGSIASSVNGKIFSVFNASTNSFALNGPPVSGTYTGGGLITRMYVPFIQTKQFPLAWEVGRKTRIGVQQYLLTKTDVSQMTLLIYLSQNASTAYNDPIANPNGSLIYSTVLFTCPESTNLGLTPANINLNTPTASSQEQIWHRINTSLIGDTVQLGFTLSDAQMRTVDINGNPISQFSEIELHGFIIDVSPSQLLV